MSMLGGVSADGELLRRALALEAAARRRTKFLRIAAFNGALLLILAADLSCKCEGYTGALHWVELCMAGVAGANLLRVCGALASASASAPAPAAAPALTAARSPRMHQPDASIGDQGSVSWSDSVMSETSDDLSLSLSPRREWRSAAAPLPDPTSHSHSHSPSHSPPHSPSRDHFIADRRTLADYLRQYEERRTASEAPAGGAGSMARAAPPPPAYQLAACDAAPPAEERGPPGAGAALWARLHLDPRRLTQFNLNLRLWLHVTILERVAREMEAADAALARLGLGAALGELPAERLRALARQPHAPSALAQLLPFLEPFPDQRYVVRRVRELARGPALSEYRWSGGGAGRDEAAPTDAELLLHLLAAYLDAQLPAAGGERPFSRHHLSGAGAGAGGGGPPPRGLAVHRVSARPPHYALALEGELLEVARGRNNLLHTLLVFVAAAAAAEPPALRRVHLGPAGLNMLWIIGR